MTTLLAEASAPGFNDGKRDSTDAEVIAVCKKFIKNINETLTALDAEPERVSLLLDERCLINSYLPLQMTEDEMKEKVSRIIANSLSGFTGYVTLGTIMAHFKKYYEGKYDARLLSGITREALK